VHTLTVLKHVTLVLLAAGLLCAQYRYPDMGGDRNRTETYLIPAPTASPMSPSWSPDSRWIAFSMWGSIWRVPAAGGQAEELTHGPGYDYEPSYSPDGKRIVFSRDIDGQIDLWEYSGTETRLTNDMALDLLPSYRSTGEIIFYSSRAGNFDIWQYPDKPLTEGRPRDIQPTASPSSPMIAFVSSRESPLGTGGLWTLNVETGKTNLVYWEETVYRARPSFSPDGEELLFSSEGDLWRIPIKGRTPFRITSGPDEDIEGRWSPDGKQVVYVSNGRELRIVSADGGEPSPVRIDDYRFNRPSGWLKVQLDGPARVAILASDGRAYTPLGAWHHVASGTETHYFHAGGNFEIQLPQGPARIRVNRGFDSEVVEQTVNVPGALNVRLKKKFELPGWYSGDTHIHDRHTGIYPVTAKDLALAAAAENINVSNMLIHMDGTKFQGDPANLTGRIHPLSTKDHILRYSEEYRSSLAHMALLGIRKMIYPVTSGTAGTSYALPWPPLFQVAERARENGAIVGLPHPYYPGIASGSTDGVREGRGATEIPVDVALGAVDYYDIACIWSDDKTAAQLYYRLLNSGFRLPVAGGTDSFIDVPRDPPQGTDRAFVRVEGALTFEKWQAGLKAGRSFATNGPLLTLQVNGREIGDELALAEPGKVRVRAKVFSNSPIDALEIVINGKVVESAPSLRVDKEFMLDRSSWIAARAIGPAHPLVGDFYAFGHTSPIYVPIAGKPIDDPAEREFFVRYIRELKIYIEGLPWTDPQKRRTYQEAYDRAIQVFQQARN